MNFETPDGRMLSGVSLFWSARARGAGYTIKMSLRILSAIALLTAFFVSAGSRAAEPSAPTLTEIREDAAKVEERHRRELEVLERGLSSQAIEADNAVMTRARIEREYREGMELVLEKRALLEKSMDAMAKSKSGGGNSTPAINPALPRIPSTSVMSYPPDSAPREEKPSAEGRQKNVGLGVRELEF
jgi:hypothetical protein